MNMELTYRGVKVNTQPLVNTQNLKHEQEEHVLFRGQEWTWDHWTKNADKSALNVVSYRGLTLA